MRRAPSPLVLGIDVGTQSTKVLVVDRDERRVIARAKREYGRLDGLAPGCAEQHPDTWMEAIRGCVADVLSHPDVTRERIAALGVAGQQHGLVALDADGCVLRPAKLWCDTSTSEEAKILAERLGRPIPVGYTASKLLWMKLHEPHLFGKIRHVMLPHDYVNFRLTDVATTDASEASGTGYFDPVAREYDSAALRAIDGRMSDWVPRVLGPLDSPGVLSNDAADWLGLPHGIVVSAGAGDNAASAIGAGATREGVVVVSLGTSATAFASSHALLEDEDALIAPFCDATGAFLPLLCLMNCAEVLEEVRVGFSTIEDLSHSMLTEAARRIPIGCDGVTIVPFLLGERAPALPNATGSILGLRPGKLRASILYRAAMEGIALNLAAGVDRMRALGLSVHSVRLVGGAAHNTLWQEILAATLETPVTTLGELDTAALGAAIQAAGALARSQGDDVSLDALAQEWVPIGGTPIEPRAEDVRAYRPLAERFQTQLRKLHRIGPRPRRADGSDPKRRQGLLFDA